MGGGGIMAYLEPRIVEVLFARLVVMVIIMVMPATVVLATLVTTPSALLEGFLLALLGVLLIVLPSRTAKTS